VGKPFCCPSLPFVRHQLVTERRGPRATAETTWSLGARGSETGRRSGGPSSRIRRLVRDFLALALALALGLWDIPATAAERNSPRGASLVDERDSARAATAAPGDEEPGRLYTALGYASFVGSAGDFFSTEYVLAGGGSELNPLQQYRGVRIGSSVAFPLVANYFTEELRKDGHPKLALWSRIALVGLKGYAIVHNLRAGAR